MFCILITLYARLATFYSFFLSTEKTMLDAYQILHYLIQKKRKTSKSKLYDELIMNKNMI